MKILAPSSILLLLAACITNATASGWEIKTEMEMPDTGKTETTVFLQGDSLRVDMPGNTMLIDLQSGEITTVMHEQKMFMTMPTGSMDRFAGMPEAAGAPAEEASGPDEPGEPGSFEPTGRKETISGFPCEEYTISSEPGLSIWFTKESPMQQSFLDRLTGLAGFQKNVPFGFDQAAGLPGFPVRVTYDDAEGSFQATILSIREKSFAASDFAPPADYKPFSLPPEFQDMMKQFQQVNP